MVSGSLRARLDAIAIFGALSILGDALSDAYMANALYADSFYEQLALPGWCAAWTVLAPAKR